MKKDSLESILAPMNLNLFMKEYYGKEMLYIEGESNKFSNYFSWNMMNQALRSQRFVHPRIRLVKDGLSIPAHEFMRVGNSTLHDTYVTKDIHSGLVHKKIKEGAVLVINAVQEMFPSVAKLERNLQWYLQDHVNVNMYLGWSKSRGFDFHFDGHDVIVIQILGSKNWHLLGFGDIAPDDVKNAFVNPPDNEVKKITLTAGDLLYLPRGYWHRAEARDEITLHLTIGIHKRTGVRFANWLMQKLRAEDSRIRVDIPREHLGQDATSYLEDFRRMVIEALSVENLREYFEQSNILVLPPKGVLLPYAIPTSGEFISDEMSFRLNSKRPVRLIERGGSFSIELHGNRWEFQNDILVLLKLILSGEVLTINSCCNTIGSLISRDDIRDVINYLITENIVSVIL